MKSEQCNKMIQSGNIKTPYRCLKVAWKDGLCQQHHPDTMNLIENRVGGILKEEPKSVYSQLQVAKKEIRKLNTTIKRMKKVKK